MIKTKLEMNSKFILIVVCNLLLNTLFGQANPSEVRLLDKESYLPIVDANFEYGQQKGVSDEDGTIRFNYEASTSMTLSHVSYGRWTISPDLLKQAIEEKVVYRMAENINLYPVSIIAVKAHSSKAMEKLNITYQDRMEHDGAKILNHLPAFNSIRKGGNYGFDPVFRGFKYDQLNIVFNGAQSATAACPNRMDPPSSQMAPNMIERIEVLKGPYALRFGSGFGATINFIPNKLQFENKSFAYGRVSTGFESNGEIGRGESQLGFRGSNYDISIFGSWSQGNDYTAGNGENVQADFERGSFGSNLGFKFNANQEVRITALYNRARDADFPALPMDLREDDTWLFNARHDIKFNGDRLKSWNTTVFGSFVDHLMDNLLKPLDPRMLNASTDATTFNYGGRTEGVWRLNKGVLYAGADLRVEGAKGIRVRDFLLGPNAGKSFEDNAWQEGSIRKLGLFTEYQISTTGMDYIFSGRLEVNHSDLNAVSDEFSNVYSETGITQLNPSFSLGLLKELNSSFRTSLWLGRAQRSGGLSERFINFFPIGQDPFEMIGNPALDPEVNNQVDLVFNWTPNNKTSVNIDVFTSYLTNYISSFIDPTLSPRLPMSPGVRRFVNIDEAFKTGFEVSWSQQLVAGLRHQLGLAYTYGQDLEREEPLPEIAPLDLRYALSASYFDEKLTPSLSFRYVAEQSRVSNEFGENPTPSFALIDFNIDYQIRESLTIHTGIQNILDENYFEHLNRSVRGSSAPIFAPGRNIFANLTLNF
jgi:iron complex outermembrane receptor protein